MIREYQGIAPTIDANVYIDESAVVIGDVHIGDRSSVWPMSVLRGDVQRITIGKMTNIQDLSVLHVTSDSEFSPGGQELTVGNGVTVGHRVILHACSVGDYCLIGMGSIIMDGAVLGEKILLAAGALVPGTKTLESGYLYAGTPAKQIRPLRKNELEFLQHSAKHYAELAGKYKQ